MAEDRPVPFDSRGDLWSAVADGIVVSQDLSPSLKFKPPELRTFGQSSVQNLQPVRTVSPPPFRKQTSRRLPGTVCDKATQTTITNTDMIKYMDTANREDRRRCVSDRILSLMDEYRLLCTEDKENM